jgi:hypothetical protein
VGKLKKQYEDANDRAEYLKSIYEDPENIDHSIITLYIRNLLAFRNKLRSIGEPDVPAKVALKKSQMVNELEKQFRKMMDG